MDQNHKCAETQPKTQPEPQAEFIPTSREPVRGLDQYDDYFWDSNSYAPMSTASP